VFELGGHDYSQPLHAATCNISGIMLLKYINAMSTPHQAILQSF